MTDEPLIAEDATIVNEDSNKPVVLQHKDSYGPEGLDIRQFYIKDGQELQPSKKGVRIPQEYEHEFLAAVLMQVLDWNAADIELLGTAMEINGWDTMHDAWAAVVESAAGLEMG
jgi:hypothetical protein